ncbi:transposase (plasmid) [Paracoccus alcaliphilus]|nr:transposase [Paracoccus alcaliphilus]
MAARRPQGPRHPPLHTTRGKKRRKPARYSKRPCRKRDRIENAFGRMKDGCGVATRYERCGGNFLNAVILAAIIIFCL